MDRIFGNGSASHRTATWEPEPTQRGTFSILSTCLITLSLCVWTAVHLNIPSREERSQDEPRDDSSEKWWSWKSLRWTAQTFRKAGWMILGILAPELVLFTALQQFWDASDLRDLPLEAAGSRTEAAETGTEAAESRTDRDLESCPDGGNDADKKPKCSLVHGYFAAMGGFEFVTGDDYDIFPRKTSGAKRTALTITPAGLRYLVENTQVKIPKLRRKLNTFGHALCALLVYCLWWYKPLDIGEPVQIPVGEETADYVVAMCVASKLDHHYSELYDLHEEWHSGLRWPCFRLFLETDNSNEIWIHKWSKNRKRDGISWILRICGLNKARRLSDLILVVYIDAGNELQIHIRKDQTWIQTQPQPAGPGKQRKCFQLHSSLSFIELDNCDTRRWELALRALSKLSGQTESRWYGFREAQDSLTDRIRNFPRFNGVRRSWPLYLVLSIIGSIYGGLHCLAWNAPFATDLERLLWRLSSVTVSSIGALIPLLYTWEQAPPIWRDFGEWTDPIDTVGQWIYDNTLGMIEHGLHPPWNRWIKNIGFWSLVPALYLFRALYDVLIVGLMLLYCLARVYLVVECFINLAHLPDSAYLLPKWSQYVPHIS
ncbi:hypothetical protein CDV36_014430 [Fusarium kuroshium]|uniref:Uncharacterized protein n=1 Tax=Fusarium kuroshium TaxID=2010991 RepID=A0A3M2RJ28_9HYPO|nr:hypothetical protein CDV36_014430 [Fusarium kuroshium]